MSALLMSILDEITQTTDREKRKYLWLAYLQQLDQHLKSYRLSPSYKELNSIRNELRGMIDHAADLRSAHQSFIGIDPDLLKGLYKTKISQEDIDLLLEDIESLMLPSSESKSSAFLDFKEFVYSITKVEPIGIEQLYTKEGYAFVKTSDVAITKVFQYKISTYANAALRIKVYFKPIMEFRYSLSRTFERVKKEIQKHHDSTSLNSYLIECRYALPFEQTVLPVAKGSLVQFINAR